MLERSRNLFFPERCPVIAFDEKRDASAMIDVSRPAERIVEQTEFLIEPTLFFHGRHRLGARRAAVDSVGHISLPSPENGWSPRLASEAPNLTALTVPR